MNKRILIAHQSAIPHYRIDFYNLLNMKLSKNYQIHIVFDDKNQKKYFLENLSIKDFNFNVLLTKTMSFRLFNKIFSIQSFIFSLKNYDIVIIEDAINNLSYLFCHLLRPIYNYKIYKWGHGRDCSILRPGFIKKNIEKFKLNLIKRSDGYLAYTKGVKKYLVEKNINSEKIFVLNNTIDIVQNRKLIKAEIDLEKIKNQLNIKANNVLLYVGRIDKRKNFTLITNALVELKRKLDDFIVIVIGDGDRKLIIDMIDRVGKNYVKYKKSIIDKNILSKYYAISDLYLFPGDVGLGPLTSISFNLIPIIIDSETHNPEVEYLNYNNSIILNKNICFKEYADSILENLLNKDLIEEKKNKSWDTIKHLTLTSMVNNFSSPFERLINERN